VVNLINISDVIQGVEPEPNWDAVDDYKNVVISSSALEPIEVCMYCGYVIDGWHRLQATKELGIRTIKVNFITEKDCELKSYFHE